MGSERLQRSATGEPGLGDDAEREDEIARRMHEMLERGGVDWVDAWSRAASEREHEEALAGAGARPRPRGATGFGRVTITEQIGVDLLARPRPGAVAPGRMSRTMPLPPRPRAMMMRKAEGAARDLAAAAAIARAHHGGGAPLDTALRRSLEAALGARLDAVRIHTGPEADAAARAAGARAFAVGEDVFFRDGSYEPASRDGQRLIAHEVAHAVQARGAAAAPAGAISQPGDPLERDADAFADAFIRQLHGAAACPERTGEILGRATAGTPGAVPFRAELERFFDRPLPAIAAFTGRSELGELGARGAATGSTVVFADAQPSLPVVAHEVAHVLQQEHVGPALHGSPHEIASEGTPAEREADAAAHAIAGGGTSAFAIRAQPAPIVHLDRDRTPAPAPTARPVTGPAGPTAPTPGATARRTPARPAASAVHPPAHTPQAMPRPSLTRAAPGTAHPQTTHPHTPHPQAAPPHAAPPHAAPPQTAPPHAAMTHPGAAASAAAASRTPQVLQGPDLAPPGHAPAATRAALEHVRAAAAAGRTALAERVASTTQAVAAAVQQQQQLLSQTGAAQRAAITQRFAAARGQVDAAVAGARTRVDGSLATQRAALTAWHAEATTSATTLFTQKQDRASSLGETYAQRATQTAETAAGNARQRIQGRAAEARRLGAQKASAASGDANEVQAMRGAAQQVAEETAAQITHGLDDLVNSLRGQGPDAARGFRDQGHQAATQLGQSRPQLQAQIDEANTATGGQLDQTASGARQSLDQLAARLHQSLDGLQQQVLGELDRQLQQKRQQLDTAGHQSIAAFEAEGRRTLAAADTSVAGFMASAAALHVTDPARAQAAGAQAATRVTAGYTTATAQVTASAGSATGAIARAGGDADTALAGVATSVAAQIDHAVGAGHAQATQAGDTATTQLAQTLTQTRASGTQMVQQVATSLDGQLHQLETSFGTGLHDFQTKLDGQIGEAEGKAADPLASLPGRIDQAMARAAARTHRSWLERQWDDFVEMASDPGFWAGLLTGIVLGLIVLAVVVLGGVTLGLGAMILIGLAIGAACAAVGTIVSNLSANPPRPWHQGLLQNVLLGAGLGALGGLVIGGVALAGLTGAAAFFAGLAATEAIAFVGTVVTNAISGQPWDKGLLANLAIAGLLHGFFEAVGGAARGGSNEPEPNGPRGGSTTDDPATAPKPPAATDDPATAPKPPAATDDPATAPKPPTATDDPATTPKPATGDPADADSGGNPRVRIIRQDDNFSAETNSKGVPKSHLDANGDLVPADPGGSTSPLEHVYGSSPAKDTSPFTSLMTEEPGGVAKTYGANEVEVDVGRLQADIDSGAVTGVQIVTPDELQAMIRGDIEAVRPGFDTDAALAGGSPDSIKEYLDNQPGLSKGAAGKLYRRLLALFNTTRDGEYLIRGTIPREYITGPQPSRGSGTVPPTTP